ncbi:MAG: D-ribose pyranase [Ardenticatenaceae bacterium]|nr:D-ribose pyranase [Ardenticatenaceae bacterium]
MRRDGILNPALVEVLARLGHTDTLVIADAGLPIPPEVQRIDLALIPGGPGFMETLRAVLAELPVERMTIASEMEARSRRLYDEVIEVCAGARIPVDSVMHEQFKLSTRKATAVVRTGEVTPYANVILHAGVSF